MFNSNTIKLFLIFLLVPISVSAISCIDELCSNQNIPTMQDMACFEEICIFGFLKQEAQSCYDTLCSDDLSDLTAECIEELCSEEEPEYLLPGEELEDELFMDENNDIEAAYIEDNIPSQEPIQKLGNANTIPNPQQQDNLSPSKKPLIISLSLFLVFGIFIALAATKLNSNKKTSNEQKEQVKTYINTCLQKGYQPDAIKQALLNSGYTEQQINESINRQF